MRGFCLVALGRHDEAEPVLRECLAIREREMPAEWLRWNAASLLGAALAGQGKYAEAEPLLVNGYNEMKDDPRVQPPTATLDRKREALERIVRLYEAWEAAEPGQGHREKAVDWRTRFTMNTSDSVKGSSR